MPGLLRDSPSLRQPPRARGFAGFFAGFGRPGAPPAAVAGLPCGAALARLAALARAWPACPAPPACALACDLACARQRLRPAGLRPALGPCPAAGLAGRNRPERGIRQRPADGRGHLVDRGHAVDRPQRALLPVIRHQRRGLGVVGRKPLLEHLRVVVGPQRLAAQLASARPDSRSGGPGCRDRPSAPPPRRAEAPSWPACGRAPRPAARCAGSRRG